MKKMIFTKVWLVLLLSVCLPNVYAQAGRVVLDLSNKTFPEAIEIFQEQTGIKFLYNKEKIKNLRCGELKIDEAEVEQALRRLLGAYNFTYSLVDGVVIIDEAPVAQQAEFQKISGRITNKDGDPLPGVSVVRKGTNVGVTSDVNGNFTLVLPGNEPVTLVFSFVGMETKEVVCRSDKPVKVVMQEASIALDEAVVNVGYQQLPRKDMVGSFTTVKAEDLQLSAYSSIDQMLQGRIAGLVAVNTSSRVGRAPKLTIRGVSTVLGNSEPLWVVDGIIQPDHKPFDMTNALTSDVNDMVASQISWLNPADIETVTVLKDASATAVYGSQASNGVIVITTKQGQADRLSVRYSVNMGFRFRPQYSQFDLMNSQERIRFSKEAYDVGVRYAHVPYPQTSTYEGLMHMLILHQIDEEFYSKQVNWLETVNTNWLKLLTRNSFNHSHNLSMSGGSKKTTYNASISYMNNKGIEIGNDIDQFSARLNVNTRMTEKLSMNFSISGSLGNSYGYGPNVNPLTYATTTSRALPAFDQNGDKLYFKEEVTYPYNADPVALGYNILNEMENSYSKRKNDNFNATLNITYKVLPVLEYQLVNGFSRSNSDAKSFAGERTRYIAENYRGYDYGSVEVNTAEFYAAMLPFGGELYTSGTNSTAWTMQHKLMFSKTFSDNHRFNAMAAAEIRSTGYRANSNTVWGFVPERGEKIISPTVPSKLKPINKVVPIDDWGILQHIYNGKWSSSERTDNFFSFFATFAYSFKDRYTLNANVRNDISNRFGQDVNKRFDPTYSFGLQWRMAEETFIKDNVGWLNQLNLRGTFGIQGNIVNSISPDLILSQGGIMGGYNEYYSTIYSLPNPLLKWERTKTWNLGLDMQLLRGVSMTLEYYGRRSNAIVNQDVAQEYGVSSLKLNGGIIKNHGVEYTLNIVPFKRDRLVWSVNVNVSKNWNRSGSSDANTRTVALTREDFLNGRSDRLLKKGYPLGAFWSYQFTGLDPENGYPTFGKLEYETANPDVDPTTFLVYSGSRNPYFTGGFNTSIKYRSISFSANFSALMGGKKRLQNLYGNFPGGKMPDTDVNLSKQLDKRWKKPGDEKYTHIPALWTEVREDINISLPDTRPSSRYTMWGNSDVRVVNASFFRCTQLALRWYMSDKWCRKIGASTLSVNASVSNVFVIASKRFRGFDPELGDSVMPKMFSFGFNVGF